MADRSIMTILKLNVQDFKKGVQEASSSLEQVLQKADKNNRVADTTFGKLQQSARYQKQEWTQVGTTLLGIGAGMSVVGASIAKTGIEYNTLQQKSRAALSTMLGSGDAAKTQLAALDAFVKQSPFSKQTFLQAQQQMIAFGIETKKVIPYLSAVQDAVAAAGGGNQQLSEIVTIMAKIKSSAKITATDLMQFGNHGIDAATLIGVAMGKTGAQIKEEITAGTLGADEALDALAEGMATKFEGAAAGIKNTMEGAWDRLGSAWRDLSASLMTPLVNPDGGGGLVDLVNRLADLLRWVEALPGPVRNVIGVLGGLATAGTLGAGAFLLFAPRVYDTITAFDALRTVSPKVAGAVSLVGKSLKWTGIAGAAALAISGIVAAIDYFSGSASRAADLAAEYGASLDKLTGKATQATRELAAQKLEEAGWLEKGAQAGIDSADMIDVLIGKRKEWADISRKIYAEFGKDAKYEWIEFAKEHAAANVDAAASLERVESAAGSSEAALDGSAEAADAAAQATAAYADEATSAADAVVAEAEAILALMDAQNEHGNSILSVRDAERAWIETIEESTSKIAENGANLDLSTEAGRANEKALDDVASAGWKLVESMSSATDANGQARYSTDEVRGAMASAREQFVNAAIAAGYEADEANRLADELGLIPKNVVSKVEVQGDAEDRAQRIQYALNNIPQYIPVRVAVTQTGTTSFTGSIQGGQGGITRAAGGPIPGIGGPTQDNIPIWASPGEHMWTAAETAAVGGHGVMYALRSMARSGDLKRILGAPGHAVGGAIGKRPAPIAQYFSPPSFAPAQVNVTAVVENPWTGEQVEAKVKNVVIDGLRQSGFRG